MTVASLVQYRCSYGKKPGGGVCRHRARASVADLHDSATATRNCTIMVKKCFPWEQAWPTQGTPTTQSEPQRLGRAQRVSPSMPRPQKKWAPHLKGAATRSSAVHKIRCIQWGKPLRSGKSLEGGLSSPTHGVVLTAMNFDAVFSARSHLHARVTAAGRAISRAPFSLRRAPDHLRALVRTSEVWLTALAAVAGALAGALVCGMSYIVVITHRLIFHVNSHTGVSGAPSLPLLSSLFGPGRGRGRARRRFSGPIRNGASASRSTRSRRMRSMADGCRSRTVSSSPSRT